MFIDNVTYDLITVFVNSKKHLTVKVLSEKIGKSRRIVYYVIEKLNIELGKNNIELIINKARVGILLNADQKGFLKNLIKDVDYILSSDERKLAMSLYISTYPKKHTVESLVDTFLVTKNTIIFDINEIKKDVKKFNKNLNIHSGRKGGYILVGEELVEIQYVYSVLKQIFNSKNSKFIQFILKLYENVSVIFTDYFITELVDKILDFEEKLGKKIAPKELNNFIFSFPYLYLFAIQTSKPNFSENLEKLKSRLEYRLLQGLFINLNSEYNEKILTLFTLILLCTGKTIDVHSASKDYTEQINLANKLFSEFEQDIDKQLYSKTDLINDIVMYLKVVAIRNEYNIVSEDVDVEIVKKNYLYIYSKIKKVVSAENANLTRENIALITMIFARAKKIQKFNLLLVTDEGSITRNLIKSRLLSNIRNLEVYTIRKSKLSDIDLSKIDLIVSTEHLEIKREVITINSLITNEDLINIFKYIINKDC